MKLTNFVFQSQLGFLLLVHSSLQADSPLTTCPTPAELNPPNVDESKINDCDCFERVRQINCHKVTKPFDLKANYNLSTLFLSNISDYKFVGERASLEYTLNVDVLVISQVTPQEIIIPSAGALEKLFSLSTRRVRLYAGRKNNRKFDVSDLQVDLDWLEILNVQDLDGFDITKFTTLRHLIMRNVHLTEASESSNANLPAGTLLQRLELINVSNFNELTNFQPKVCHAGAEEKIDIKLRKLPDFTTFDFTRLFPEDQPCQYYIDLSDNPQLDPELLNRARTSLKPDRMFLIMFGSPVHCSCSLWKTLGNSVVAENIRLQCSNRKNKQMRALEASDFKPKCE